MKSTIVALSSDVLETTRDWSEQKLQCLVFGVIFTTTCTARMSLAPIGAVQIPIF